jgi:hypothetical protein
MAPRRRPARAPRAVASAANDAPSARWPRMATNTVPRETARLSCAMLVTTALCWCAASTRSRASGASVRAALTSAPSVIVALRTIPMADAGARPAAARRGLG